MGLKAWKRNIIIIAAVVVALAVALLLVLLKPWESSSSSSEAQENPDRHTFESPLAHRTVYGTATGDLAGIRLGWSGSLSVDGAISTILDEYSFGGYVRDGVEVRRGQVYVDNEEFMYVSGALRPAGRSGALVLVVCEDRLVLSDGEQLYTLDESVQVKDAYISGETVVWITPNNMQWYNTKTGEVEASVVLRGNSLTELSGGRCAVGCPLTEEVHVYDKGILVDTLKIPGPKGHTLFGHSVSYAEPFLAVGAPREGAGTVYIFAFSDVFYAYAMMRPEMAEDRQDFGHSVLMRDKTLYVGSPYYADQRGAVDELKLN